MNELWQLVTNLDGIYNRTVWQSQEGAIADRERILKPRRQKINGEWKTFVPLGYTAISRVLNSPR